MILEKDGNEENPMKNLIIKSKQMIILQVVIAILLLLNVTNLFATYRMVCAPENSLSEMHMGIFIEDTTEAEKLIDNITTNKEPLLVEKELSYLVNAVYFNGDQFQPDLISGRNFTKEDFLNQENVALIDRSMKEKCIHKDDKQYYIYQGKEFEVIGIYKKGDNKVNEDANVYINLMSFYVEEAFDRSGDYQIDGGKNTRQLMSELDRNIEIQIIYDFSNRGLYTEFRETLYEQNASVIAISLIMLMLFINQINVIRQWVVSRKSEIYVLHLAGVVQSKINQRFIFDYYKINGISFLIAIPIAAVLMELKWKIFIGFELSLGAVLGTYIVYLILSLYGLICLLFIMCKSKLKDGRICL